MQKAILYNRVSTPNNTASKKLIDSIVAAYGEFERVIVSERIKRGIREKKMKKLALEI